MPTDLTELKCRWGSYTVFAGRPFARSLWLFLKRPDMQLRMEVASGLERPAVEVLSEPLISRYGLEINQPEIKRMIGHMVAQIMIAMGYRLDQRDVRISRPGMFKTGARYAQVGRESRAARLGKKVSPSDEVLREWAGADEFTRVIDGLVYDSAGKLNEIKLERLAKAFDLNFAYNTREVNKLDMIALLRAELNGDPAMLRPSDTLSDITKVGGEAGNQNPNS